MKLGRIPVFDPRSLHYRAVAYTESKPLLNKQWVCSQVFNQGLLSACVGFSWSHYLVTAPDIVQGVDERFAINLYHEAQKLDEFPGENYEGTSVLAGVKALKQNYPHLISGYRWAFGLDEVLQVLSYQGPCVLGLEWFSSMFDPDETGKIVVGGANVGGHAILATGINVDDEEVTLHNSWGFSYGIAGKCFISFSDLKHLLKLRGECCVPVGKDSTSLVTNI